MSSVTLKEIAEVLGVSIMTVSRALNNRTNVDEKTREKVLKKAREMGYTPNHVAKSLVSKKTYTIGVVIPEISHNFFAQVVEGIEEVTYKMNYQLILTNSTEDSNRERKALETLRAKQVDGILISCAMETNDYSYYKEVINSNMPMVFFDRCIEELGVSTVSVNDKTGSEKITQHMIDHGYKKFGYLRGPEVTIGKERLLGFRETLRKNNIEVREEWIIESGFQESGGYSAMKRLLEMTQSTASEDHPRAILAVNDPVAIGAIDAMDEFGLSIPDDIAIGGFSNDIRSKLLKCPLTTVDQPAKSIGRKAAEKLIKVIENKDEPTEYIDLLTNLVIRKSCGCT